MGRQTQWATTVGNPLRLGWTHRDVSLQTLVFAVDG